MRAKILVTTPNLRALMERIPQRPKGGPIGGRTELRARLWPNGEIAIWKQKTFQPEPLPVQPDANAIDRKMSILRLGLHCPDVLSECLLALGLSPHHNFDSLLKEGQSPDEGSARSLLRYGRNGITSYGARRVRNGCHLIERGLPKKCAVFATATVPALPVEDLGRIHERWNKVVETYRRKLARALRSKGLSGESVTVSEIQSKRYERSGIPVLHIHTVFSGRTREGKRAISTEEHDRMWLDALTVGCCGPIPKLRSACNLQWVKESAEGYLGKYMTKGTQIVSELCEAGFEGWLPKQWWAMSRSLSARIDDETRDVTELSEWLNDVAEIEGADVWLWHRDIQVEIFTGQTITVARYGRLSPYMTQQIMGTS